MLKHAERARTSPLNLRLAGGAFWSTVGAFAYRGLTLLTYLIVARCLGKEGFGELGIIQSTVSSLNVLAGFGLSLTSTKFVAQFKFNDPAKASRIMALSSLTAMVSGGLMSLLLFTLAPWLATKALAAYRLGDLLQIAAFLVFLNAINGSQTGALSGLEAFKTIAWLNMLSGLCGLLLITAGAYCKGIYGALWGALFHMGLTLILNHTALTRAASKHGLTLSYTDCLKEWKILRNFAMPTVLSGLVVAPVNWACAAILVNQTNGYSEMGVFNAANQWHTAILFFPSIISLTALPIMTNLHADSNQTQYLKLLKNTLLINIAAVVTIALPVSLLSPLIMASYGHGFRSGWSILALLAVSAVIAGTLTAIGQAITSIGRMWWGFALNLVWAVTHISTFWLLRGQGAFGLATANLISYGVHFVSVTLFVVFAFSSYAREMPLRGS